MNKLSTICPHCTVDFKDRFLHFNGENKLCNNCLEMRRLKNGEEFHSILKNLLIFNNIPSITDEQAEIYQKAADGIANKRMGL